MNKKDKPQPTADAPLDEDYYEHLSQMAEADDFTIGPDAVTHPGQGQEPGREFLTQYMSPTELAAASRRGRGRPSLSGSGRSPARQVRLPEDLDAQLAARAKAEGRPVSHVLREAVVTYLHSA